MLLDLCKITVMLHTALWKKLFFVLTTGFLAVLLLSCATTEEPETEQERPPVIVGKVSKVFPQHGFVLIRYERHIAIPEKDTVLLSQNTNGSRRANLAVTGERLPGGRDFPADIKSGKPEVGDLVMLYESLENAHKTVTILNPEEDGTLTKPEEVKVPMPLDDLNKNMPTDEDLERFIREGEFMKKEADLPPEDLPQ